MLFAPGAWGVLGMRSCLIGIGIGLVAVVLTSMNLMLDFEYISQGVRNGVDARYSWSAAFGLTVTLVWLYIEFLRLAAIFEIGRASCRERVEIWVGGVAGQYKEWSGRTRDSVGR